MADDQHTDEPNHLGVIASATVAWAYVLAVGVGLLLT
jgi:hypothetical protein